MITNAQRQVIARWYPGLERGDIEDLVRLFAPHPWIRNAAMPPMEGPDAPRRLLTEFFAHTIARRFSVLDGAAGDGQLFVGWTGDLTFASAGGLEDVIRRRSLTVTLRGVERFQLDDQGRIEQLDVFHETTSVTEALRKAGLQV